MAIKIRVNVVISKMGITFFCWDLHQDEVMWVWPWRRDELNNGLPWYSYSFHSSFETWKQLTATWEDYEDSMKKGSKEDYE